MSFNEINDPRLNLQLHRELGIIEGAPAPQLAPEVVATVDLTHPQPEHLYLRQERSVSVEGEVTNVAGEYGYSICWNPASSGVLMIVEALSLTLTGAALMLGGVITSNIISLGTIMGGQAFKDSREPMPSIAGGTPIICSHDTAVSAALVTRTCFGWRVPANDTKRYLLGFVCAPGDGVAIRHATANTAYRCIWEYRFRKLMTSETK